MGLTIISAKNPKFNENGTIDMLVDFESIGEVPFTASLYDTESHCIDLYQRALSGEFGEIQPFAYDMDKLRNELLDKVNNEKNRIRANGVLIDNVLFDSDASAYDAYTRLAIKMMANTSFYVENWKASEGIWVSMDFSTFDKLMIALSEKETSAFNWLKGKQDEINTAYASNNVNNLLTISTEYI